MKDEEHTCRPRASSMWVSHEWCECDIHHRWCDTRIPQQSTNGCYKCTVQTAYRVMIMRAWVAAPLPSTVIQWGDTKECECAYNDCNSLIMFSFSLLMWFTFTDLASPWTSLWLRRTQVHPFGTIIVSLVSVFEKSRVSVCVVVRLSAFLVLVPRTDWLLVMRVHMRKSAHIIHHFHQRHLWFVALQLQRSFLLLQSLDALRHLKNGTNWAVSENPKKDPKTLNPSFSDYELSSKGVLDPELWEIWGSG